MTELHNDGLVHLLDNQKSTFLQQWKNWWRTNGSIILVCLLLPVYKILAWGNMKL
jgi:predicted negative regulator of RcsB-dependent stress response